MNDFDFSESIVLVVDDSPTNLEVISGALATANINVAVALDGESALEQVRYKAPDLILLDVMMPGMTGFETCARLKADPATADIPIIFMTALSDPTDKVKGLSIGGVDYITKPFLQEELLARVKVHVKLYYLTRTLETKVEERTAELRQAIQNLKQAQVQLVQSEKMSSLGQLVAGIAHEINNPVNFIHGNLDHATHYIKDLLELIKLYQQFHFDTAPEIEEYSEDIDLEFLKEDLPKLLASMRVGTERIREIVRSLRTFSRLDEAERKAVDIHEGIDSTLMILGNRIKAKSDRPAIQVVKDYGKLPLVGCYPGKLNQVFMNVVTNAIDALEEAYTNRQQLQPCLWLTTELNGADKINIRISDNGKGMSEEVRTRIFEPFFTTKDVGKGTGMGMSISYQIISESHGGSIDCHSTLGEGTEFIITIPIHPEVAIS